MKNNLCYVTRIIGFATRHEIQRYHSETFTFPQIVSGVSTPDKAYSWYDTLNQGKILVKTYVTAFTKIPSGALI